MNMIVTENFLLEDLTYIPVGNYNPVLNRPYVVNAKDNAIQTIAERMYDTKSGKITPNIINGVAGDIIQPSSVGYATGINSDWISTRRFVFILKVKSFDHTGIEINSYITGYTDYDGISASGHPDGNLNHFINNVIETTSMAIQTPLGVIRKEKLYRIYNVFAAQGQQELYAQRPADVLENINMLNMANVMADGQQMNMFNTQNFINAFNQNTVASTIDNNITTEYLSKILTTGVLVNKSKDIHIDSYSISEQNSVDSKVPEPSVADNRFIKYLSRLAGFKTTREVFNFNQLMSIDNTIYTRFKLINLNKDYVNPVMASTPEVGDYWHGQDPVTVKAYSLIENAVSLAVKYGFNVLYFTASNMSNPTGLAEVFITNFNSFINLEEHDFNYLLEIFKEKFITEVFLNETNAGRIPMHMEGYIDLIGTSKINLSYAGFPSNWYTIPTFANSLFSPVVTIDKNAFDYTSFQLNQVIDTLANEHNVNRSFF